MSRVLLNILCCDMSHIIMATLWLNMSIMLVTILWSVELWCGIFPVYLGIFQKKKKTVLLTILWFDMVSVVTILWPVDLCVTYDSLKSKKYPTNSSIWPLLQRMPDMSNLHEVQTVDMLPPEMNSQLQQVKLSCDAVILIFLHTQTLSFLMHLSSWHYFLYVIKNLKCPFYFTQSFSLLSHHSKIIREN